MESNNYPGARILKVASLNRQGLRPPRGIKSLAMSRDQYYSLERSPLACCGTPLLEWSPPWPLYWACLPITTGVPSHPLRVEGTSTPSSLVRVCHILFMLYFRFPRSCHCRVYLDRGVPLLIALLWMCVHPLPARAACTILSPLIGSRQGKPSSRLYKEYINVYFLWSVLKYKKCYRRVFPYF